MPEATLIDRCRQRNRSDDNENAIRERIRVYNTKSAEVVNAYDQQSKVARITQPTERTVDMGVGYFIKAKFGKLGFNTALQTPVGMLHDVISRGIILWEMCEIRDDQQ